MFSYIPKKIEQETRITKEAVDPTAQQIVDSFHETSQQLYAGVRKTEEVDNSKLITDIIAKLEANPELLSKIVERPDFRFSNRSPSDPLYLQVRNIILVPNIFENRVVQVSNIYDDKIWEWFQSNPAAFTFDARFFSAEENRNLAQIIRNSGVITRVTISEMIAVLQGLSSKHGHKIIKNLGDLFLYTLHYEPYCVSDQELILMVDYINVLRQSGLISEHAIIDVRNKYKENPEFKNIFKSLEELYAEEISKELSAENLNLDFLQQLADLSCFLISDTRTLQHLKILASVMLEQLCNYIDNLAKTAAEPLKRMLLLINANLHLIADVSLAKRCEETLLQHLQLCLDPNDKENWYAEFRVLFEGYKLQREPRDEYSSKLAECIAIRYSLNDGALPEIKQKLITANDYGAFINDIATSAEIGSAAANPPRKRLRG
jgi:hypothetical protein